MDTQWLYVFIPHYVFKLVRFTTHKNRAALCSLTNESGDIKRQRFTSSEAVVNVGVAVAGRPLRFGLRATFCSFC